MHLLAGFACHISAPKNHESNRKLLRKYLETTKLKSEAWHSPATLKWSSLRLQLLQLQLPWGCDRSVHVDEVPLLRIVTQGLRNMNIVWPDEVGIPRIQATGTDFTYGHPSVHAPSNNPAIHRSVHRSCIHSSQLVGQKFAHNNKRDIKYNDKHENATVRKPSVINAPFFILFVYTYIYFLTVATPREQKFVCWPSPLLPPPPPPPPPPPSTSTSPLLVLYYYLLLPWAPFGTATVEPLVTTLSEPSSRWDMFRVFQPSRGLPGLAAAAFT